MFLSLRLPSSLEYLCIGEDYMGNAKNWDVWSDGEDVLKSCFLLNNPALLEVHFNSPSIHLDWLKGKVREGTQRLQTFLLINSTLFSFLRLGPLDFPFNLSSHLKVGLSSLQNCQ
jgi:hypothetical protein